MNEPLTKPNVKITFQSCLIREKCICDVESSVSDNKDDKQSKQELTRYEEAWQSLAGSAIYCICLIDKEDRFRLACENAHRVGLCRLIKFLRPRKPTVDEARLAGVSEAKRGFWGSWESHRAVAIHARYELKAPRALVLEDDFQFLPTQTSAKIVTQIDRDYLPSLSKTYDIFYLGHMPWYGIPHQWPAVWKTASCFIHAYVLSEHGQLKLQNMSFVDNVMRCGKEQTLDAYVAREFEQYALYPQICVQNCATRSDNLENVSTADYITERWTEFHRDHSYAIETCVYFIAPIVWLLLMVFLLRKFKRFFF